MVLQASTNTVITSNNVEAKLVTVLMLIDKHKLVRSLQGELPGWAAQKAMAPDVGSRYKELSADHRLAAVMALIHEDESGKSNIIIIERARHNDNDKHAGQLSFPGGKYEDEDGDMLVCALREVEEEIGLSADHIEVLGPLSRLYVFASNFLVYPFVGYVKGVPKFYKQDSEVHSIISVPMEVLLADHNKLTKDIDVRGSKLQDVPYYQIGDQALWGATAMIMSELEHLLLKTQI